MGSQQSKINTIDFFLHKFADDNKFIYTLESGEAILFSYKYEETKIDYITVYAEVLKKPHEKSSVTIRSPRNCDCKSDAFKYEPTVEFKVYYNINGFHDKKYTKNTTKETKHIINEFEKNHLNY